MRTVVYLTLCSMQMFYCHSLEFIADNDGTLSVFTFCNDTNEPIWIGIISGRNILFKGEIAAKSNANKSNLYTIQTYDRETNTLGINLKAMNAIALWLKNPLHKCRNFDFWYPLECDDAIQKVCAIWHGHKGTKSLEIRYLKDCYY